jgi:alpha-L-arabinofuranosidase
LQQPGGITVGYAFLQPGAWGRYEGLPLRRDLVAGVLGQGIRVMRFDGSAVNRCPEPQFYKWKRMIGPTDLRQPFRGTFNPYSSNGFGIFDFLNMAEKMGVVAIPGVRSDETPQDMADFMEYVNGSADSTWGKRRAADGHPNPYNLRHLEIGNEEQHLIAPYCAYFQAIAQAIWERDPAMVLVISLNLRSPAGQDLWSIGPGGKLSQELESVAQVLRFAQRGGHTVWIDNHLLADGTATAGEKNPTVTTMRSMKLAMAQLVPGYDLGFASLEENGPAHDMARGLAHACNMHALARMGSDMRAIAVADGLQAWQQELVWSQGNTFFTPDQVWFQPAYLIDQAMGRNWATDVAAVTLDGGQDSLDVLARLSGDKRRLILQVVNPGAAPVTVGIVLRGFHPKSASATVTEIAAAPSDSNTLESPQHIAPQQRLWRHTGAYTFASHSFTLMAFE